MDLKKIRIREDKYLEYNSIGCHCDKCNTKFKNKDIVLELDLYETYWRFCSKKCLLDWIMDDIEEKEIEIYPVPDRIKNKKEINDKIDKMEPNTSIIINNIKVEYYKSKDLTEHYIIFNEVPKIFLDKTKVIDYILKNL